MNMQPLRLFLAALAVLTFHNLSAQCTYRLEMFDSFGDGWNGGQLTVTSGTTTQIYTLNNITDNGTDSTVFITVLPGEPLSFVWLAGAFINEVSMQVYDANDVLLFAAAVPPSGTLFSGVGVCPPCAKPQNVQIENIYDTRVKLRWSPGIAAQTAASWQVIYGPAGFVPAVGVGDTVVVTQPKVTINGLQPKTGYTFYVTQICADGSESFRVGPIDFETYWANDIAVTGIVSPQSGCELGVEVIRFAMTNLGSNPQSLIPYTFLVNGEFGGVPQPEDGFYTGVIGKDSTEVIEFETTYDFSDPGEYQIIVIVQMPGDEDTANDTLTYYINNRLVAPTTQTFENWNGGWEASADPFGFAPSSWAWGVPAAPIISAAGEGQRAWVTNLTGLFNFGERSFLTSTCFDFSDLSADPAIRFSYNINLDGFEDGLWLQTSIDNGLTWQIVGEQGEGFNWYNTFDPFTGVSSIWAGSTNGWVNAQHRLDGVAGESNVLLRFGFRGGFFPQGEGAGIDNISVVIPEAKDLATAQVTTDGDNTACGLQNDKVNVTVVNVGAQALPPSIALNYSVNGGTPVQQTFTGNILTPDENFTVTFTTGFDSRDQLNVIKVWSSISGDTNAANDTITYTIDHRPLPVPFREDFEVSTELPARWVIEPVFAVAVTNLHNNVSNVLAINLYGGTPICTYDLPRYGVVDADDTLRFDYRLTDWNAGINPTQLTAGTKIETFVSTNCGQTFQLVNTVNQANHTPSAVMQTRKIPLTQFAGQSISVRFVGTWGTGDFWFDLDNVGIIACNTTMDLSAVVTNTNPGQSGGAATVQVGLGNPPYTYAWSTGAATGTATGLAIGTYTVSVSDSNGCSDVLEVSIGDVSAGELPGLTQWAVRPNPTTGLLMVDVGFEQSVELQADLVNLLGQSVWSSTPGRTSSLSEVIDLSRHPAGMYLLRVRADGQVLTKKVIKN
jgi:hypothetical protein